LQVTRLQEKVKGQGEQSEAQAARSALQSKPPQSLQGVGHVVVLPSQVTCPGSLGQAPFTALHAVPLQLTVPPFQQFAVHMDFRPIAGRLAASTGAGAPAWTAREATKA